MWFDYDGDGLLDLFVGGYYPEDVDLWHLKNTRMMPESFEYAKNGGRKYLFHNLGNGHFEEVSAKVGINSRRWALASAAADLRGTGHPDLFIANDYGVSELFLNDGKRFHEAGAQTGVGFAPKSGMNVAVGDIFNQGRYSVYVSNISEEGVLIQGNNLWVPKEGDAPGTVTYQNMARDLGVELGGWSFGAQFGDLNNDGNLDLFLTNGYVSLDRNRSYWYDFAKVAGGNSAIISDADHWPAIDGRSHSGYQQKRVWVNDGAGKFVDVAQAVGVTDTHDGRSVVMADLFNNGALDVVVANQRGPLLLYRNTVDPRNKWIEFALEGTKSNRSAIGAEVTRSLERPNPDPGGLRRQRFRVTERPPPPLRSRSVSTFRWSPDTLAVWYDSNAKRPQDRAVEQHQGAGVSVDTLAIPARPDTASTPSWRRWFSMENRYLPPAFITLILLVGHFSFGILESWTQTLLAIATSIATELFLGKLVVGKWPNVASAYISGISVGILLRSPALWPFAVCAALAITSKYAVRYKNRHLWNPSNFAICVVIFLAADTVATLSIQWGNNIWAMLVIWALGSAIIWRLRRFHICATYVLGYVLFAAWRAHIVGDPFLSELSPITGPEYQLFIFFMMTDPKTTVRSRLGQCAVAFVVAAVEMLLRLHSVIYAPLYALFLVGPPALLLSMWWNERQKPARAQADPHDPGVRLQRLNPSSTSRNLVVRSSPHPCS